MSDVRRLDAARTGRADQPNRRHDPDLDRHALEWRCPECDYFEKVDGPTAGLSPELQAWIDK